MKAHWSVFVGAFVLLAGIVVGAYGQFRPLPEPKFKARLADVLPKADEVPGWEIWQEQIADTPEMKKAVVELLNYDEAVFTTYTRGHERVSIYIAYWKPGRMSHRLVAGHTPDVCWVGNGWTVIGKSENSLVMAGQGRTQPAQERRMNDGNVEETVLFWHFAGRGLVSYRRGIPPWHAMFSDLIERHFEQRQEQIFIRVSAPTAFRNYSRSRAVQMLLRNLQKAGVPLAAPDPVN